MSCNRTKIWFDELKLPSCHNKNKVAPILNDKQFWLIVILLSYYCLILPSTEHFQCDDEDYRFEENSLSNKKKQKKFETKRKKVLTMDGLFYYSNKDPPQSQAEVNACIRSCATRNVGSILFMRFFFRSIYPKLITHSFIHHKVIILLHLPIGFVFGQGKLKSKFNCFSNNSFMFHNYGNLNRWKNI